MVDDMLLERIIRQERPLATVFFSYSHVDEALRDQLETQLAMLKRQGAIETWHDRRIGAGENLHDAIDSHINTADIILLLVSPEFLASDYCYEREMRRAMERHEAGEATVIPVILRPSDWHGAPFGSLMATPPDGRPVTQWPDRDQAFLEVVRAIRGAAERFNRSPPQRPAASGQRPEPSPSTTPVIRSSNLRVARQFTERDKDTFQQEAFDYLAKFFENSVEELGARNPGIEGTFRRIDANRFTAVVYRNGHALSRCTVFMGGRPFGSGIAYSNSETTESNSFN
jgi:TIR domain